MIGDSGMGRIDVGDKVRVAKSQFVPAELTDRIGFVIDYDPQRLMPCRVVVIENQDLDHDYWWFTEAELEVVE